MCNSGIDLHQFWLSCGLAEDALAEALESYRRYYELILAHNEAAGLMGRVSAQDFYSKHVADSLAVLSVWPDVLTGSVHLADVGCGAGLPGIVLAVALPELRLTAIESNHRKADFVEMAAAELGLAGRVEVLAVRSRQLGHDDRYRNQFDVVTTRAVAPAGKVIRDVRMLIAPGGSAILYKTPATVTAEESLAHRQADKYKLAIEISETIALPAGAGTRQFVRIIAPG